MTRSALPVASMLLLMACGRPTATVTVAPSKLAPPDAFQCILSAFKPLGFQRTMFDEQDLRTSARKENPTITVSNTTFRKAWDRLDAEVQTGSTGTEIKLAAVTEAEFFSQNGKSFERLSPSAQVQQAAGDLGTRCGGSAPISNDSVPSTAQ